MKSMIKVFYASVLLSFINVAFCAMGGKNSIMEGIGYGNGNVNDSNEDTGKGLSGSEIAGIVIGALLGVSLFGWLVYHLRNKRKKSSETTMVLPTHTDNVVSSTDKKPVTLQHDSYTAFVLQLPYTPTNVSQTMTPVSVPSQTHTPVGKARVLPQLSIQTTFPPITNITPPQALPRYEK